MTTKETSAEMNLDLGCHLQLRLCTPLMQFGESEPALFLRGTNREPRSFGVGCNTGMLCQTKIPTETRLRDSSARASC